MVDKLQYNQSIGFREESVDGTSPITTTEKPIYFGVHSGMWSTYPELKQLFQSLYRGQYKDPYKRVLTKTYIMGNVAFIPVDGLALHLVFGDAVSGGTGIHSLTPIDTGDLPSFSLRYETSNETDFHRKEVVGCKVKRFNMSIDLAQPDSFLIESIDFSGKRQFDEGDLVSNEFIAPIYADDNALSAQTPYRVDDDFILEWDTNGTPVDLKTNSDVFSYYNDTLLKLHYIKDQLYPQWITTGIRVSVIGLKIRRTDITDFFDDFVGQQSSETYKALKMKIHNNVGYIQVIFSDVVINRCTLNHAVKAKDEEPYYIVEMLPKSVVFEIKDGVDTTLYGYEVV